MRHRWILIFLVVAATLGAQPIAGTLDLTRWDGHSVTLNATWLFWPRSEPVGPGTPLRVPGVWNSVTGSTDGWGTYRLTIHLEAVPTDLALRLPIIDSAAVVRWNGAIVWQAGTFGATREAFKGGWRTGVVKLPAIRGDNVLEVGVANWGNITGGLTAPLSLGRRAPLFSERTSDILLTVFLFGALFLMGLYHIGLFAYRRVDRGPLWFGCISLLLALRGLVYGPCYAMDILPDMSWEVLMKIGYLTFSGSVLFVILFIRSVFPKTTPRWFAPVGVVGAGSYALANLALPAAWYTPALPEFQIFTVVMGFGILAILIRALTRRDPGAGLFLAGFALLFAASLNDTVKVYLPLPTPALSAWGLFAFLVFQSMVLLRQFTGAFVDSERHARHLANLNTSLERFIPREVLSFLGKRSIEEVAVGDHGEYSMAVMFADIRDFTGLSETMNPEENFRFINSYLSRVGPVVRRHGGFVDKYMGDGIMALFSGQAGQALDAALDMMRVLVEYNEQRATLGYRPIRIGIGVHHGPLLLGTIGENQRMDSSAIGDTVRVASRLEGLTKKFSKNILVSGEIVAAVEGAAGYRFDYVDAEVEPGRPPLKVYTLEPEAV